MKFCNNCGKQIEDKEMFCGNCGKELSSSSNISYYSKRVSINFADYFKDPISTIKSLVSSLDFMITGIILLVMSVSIAYVPYKPINKVASKFFMAFDFWGGDYGSEIKWKIKSIYFTFLMLAILFLVIGGLVVSICANVKGKKESFFESFNIYLICIIPAVLAICLSSFILGVNTLSIMIIVFGFTISTILLYSQLRKVLLLSEIEAFVLIFLINVLTYSITFYVGMNIIKDKLSSLF